MSNGLMVRLVGNRTRSPGPAAYSTRRRAGQDSPAWTIKNRYKQKIEAIDADYVNLESTIGRGPKISMKSRHENLPPIETPGPNYIPKNFGSETTPIHVSPRYGERKREVSPGPGHYSPREAPSTARISIRGRTKMPESGVDSPGPAGYSPDYTKTRASARSPTIGRRASEPKKQITPGPSDYNVSRDITKGQGISMHIRPKDSDIAVTPGPSDYGNPSNPSTSRSPAYTIGNRVEQKTDTNQAGFVNLPSTVGQGPKISMSSRHEARSADPTPGPNYVPPSMAQSGRGITIGGRAPDGKTEVTPGPGQYNTMNTSGVDGVTPISIKGKNYMPERTNDSPGPAGYSPDYTATRKGAPSPTIGRRGNDPKIPVTPGPSDYDISRDITSGNGGISMHIRPGDRDIAVTPGPSDYGNPNDPSSSRGPAYTIGNRVEQKMDTNQAGFVNLPSTVGQGPKISMSSRHDPREAEPTPGPNYVPPSLAQTSRGVTIGNRAPDGKIDVTPGPGQYNTLNATGVDGVTPISIKGKNYMPERTNDSPGPAGYSPDYTATRKSSPSPTIGRRGIDPKIAVTPGPSDYDISRDITNGNGGISMHIRPGDRDIAVTPGPSDYGNPNDPASSRGPAYTIGNRVEQKMDTNQAGFVNLPSTVGQGPKISMSSRHDVREAEPTPGPNYVPPSLAQTSRGVTIGNRAPDGKIDVTPGPGQYNTMNATGVDGVTPISIKGKNYMPERTNDSPGPAGYSPDYTATRKSSPSPTIGRRGIDPKIAVTPGPSDYDISRDITSGNGGISMHIRPGDRDIAVTPGPSDYGNPNDPSSSRGPAYTIGNRVEQKIDTNQAGFVNLPSTVGQGPKISMSSRHDPREAEPTPGPNYIPPSLAESSRGVTIGNRAPDGKIDVTPGPGQYNTLNATGVDGVTPIAIKGRNYPPERTNDSPGPAGYSPDYTATRKGAPSPTIGRRGIDPKIPVTPGPSDYDISRDITNGNGGISMHIRPGDRDIAVTPGPSDYGNPNDPSSSRGPAYTIGNRVEQKMDTNQAGFVNLPSTVGQGPKISMSSRHDAREAEPTPGPNYVPPSLAESSRGVTIGNRAPDGKIDVTPGPGQYNTLNATGVDGVTPISIKGKNYPPEKNNDSPGPAGYNPDYSATRKSSPSPTIGRRGIDPKIAVTPGPSDYDISRDITSGNGGISMHIRPGDRDIAVTPGPSDYGNPNDPSSSRGPAYTIGNRVEQKMDTNQAGFVNLPSTVGQGPKISMSSRHDVREAEPTPGPNYVPPSLAETSRGVTIGNRAPDGKIEVTPGPGQYNTMNATGVDGVTPIAIKGRNYPPERTNDSPGPAGYSPDYTATRKGAPSPTIGRRGIDPKIAVTPGPSDYDISRDITNGNGGISMHIRPGDRDIAVTPGPSDYGNPNDPSSSRGPAYTIGNRVEQKMDTNQAGFVNLPSTVGQGPKISMSSRHDVREAEPTPGPNYVPPSLAETSRGVTIGNRAPDGKIEVTPGPGQYNTMNATGVDGVTPITIKGRNYMPERTNDSPGPAGYSPDYTATRKGAPSPTIGLRGIDPKIPVTPGPSDYDISRDITSGNGGISMHIRPGDRDIAVTPGPSDYGNPNDPSSSRGPAYTIGNRVEQKMDTNQAGFVNLPSTVGQGPKISMSSRHDVREAEPTPGPNYIPPSLAESSRGVTIGNRAPDGKIDVTPGPGQYNTMNATGVDGVTPISIKGKNYPPEKNNDSPGPAGYNPDYSATRKSSPSPTIGRRGIDPKIAVTPGPSDYDISRDITNDNGGISMHIRPGDRDIAVTPGPSDYGNPNDPSSSRGPAYTIGNRVEQKMDTNQAGFVNLPSTVGQGPKISMSSRHDVREAEPTPGPNYVPPSLAESSRGVTIGNRAPDGKIDVTPGPGQYNTLNATGVDGVTPITIKGRNYMPERTNDSPGPAGYSPDYTATRKGAPSPTIGLRGIDPKIPVTPGPSDYDISRDITNGSGGISMHIRPGDRDIAVTPGPSDYGNPNDPSSSRGPAFTIGNRVEQKMDTNQAGFVNLPSTVGQGPKISMSSRHDVREAEPTPGPNYVPPSLAETSRGVTIGNRAPDGKIDVTPGPGQYNTMNASGVDGVTPISIKGRNYMPEKNNDSPGPAGYNPDYSATRKSAPSPTIGRRGIDPKIAVTPGPSDYDISRDITNGNGGISMHIRPGDRDIAVTPGPSDYGNPNDPSSSRGPAFTIGNRVEQKMDTNQAGFVNLPSTVGQGPKISMSSRHDVREAEPTPGPNYVPPSLGGKGITIGNRTPDGRTEITPGPGQYNTINATGVDGVTPISIKGRNYMPGQTSESPGPAAYDPMYNPPLDSKGITIGVKFPEKKPESTPGFYDIPSTRGGPAFTIGLREDCDVAIL